MPGFRPRIAIAGGGPSGLTLGLLLSRQNIPTTIYELRRKPAPEEIAKPSGMLDLHEESGLKAMRECGLWSSFQAALGDCSESTRVMGSDGVVLHNDEGELAYRPEIPRNTLNGLLAWQVPEHMIKWGRKIAGARRAKNAVTGATEITLDLSADCSEIYDLVIGADGAWSRIRHLLSDIRPTYGGAQMLTATVTQVSSRFPHLASLNGSGTLYALEDGNAIMTHRGPQDSIRVYAAVRTPDEHWVTTAGLQGQTAAEVKAKLLAEDTLFRSWAPSLQSLLATACDEETKDNSGAAADIAPLYMLPVGHRWEHGPGATLIGDAAHLMMPWAGEGVNLALWDALDLARVLTSLPKATDALAWQSALGPRLRDFEETMQARAQEKAEETIRNRDLLLGEHGAQRLVSLFQGVNEPA